MRYWSSFTYPFSPPAGGAGVKIHLYTSATITASCDFSNLLCQLICSTACASLGALDDEQGEGAFSSCGWPCHKPPLSGNRSTWAQVVLSQRHQHEDSIDDSGCRQHWMTAGTIRERTTGRGRVALQKDHDRQSLTRNDSTNGMAASIAGIRTAGRQQEDSRSNTLGTSTQHRP